MLPLCLLFLLAFAVGENRTSFEFVAPAETNLSHPQPVHVQSAEPNSTLPNPPTQPNPTQTNPHQQSQEAPQKPALQSSPEIVQSTTPASNNLEQTLLWTMLLSQMGGSGRHKSNDNTLKTLMLMNLLEDPPKSQTQARSLTKEDSSRNFVIPIALKALQAEVGSCEGACGRPMFKRRCGCDFECESHRDCCPDYYEQCVFSQSIQALYPRASEATSLMYPAQSVPFTQSTPIAASIPYQGVPLYNPIQPVPQVTPSTLCGQQRHLMSDLDVPHHFGSVDAIGLKNASLLCIFVHGDSLPLNLTSVDHF